MFGGIVGHQIDSNLTNSYSASKLNGQGILGGTVGFSKNSISNSTYWDKEYSNINTSANGEGKTSNEMKNQSTYINWDFENIWEIQNNYPKLK